MMSEIYLFNCKKIVMMAQEEEVMNCDVGSKIKSHDTNIIHILAHIYAHSSMYTSRIEPQSWAMLYKHEPKWA
jgi:hypothetical protein